MASILADPTLRTAPAVKPRRRQGIRASDEAVLTLTKPVANRQAKIAWACTCLGMIPVLGLFLAIAGLFFAWLGLQRVRRKPEDLGIRHVVGAFTLGGIEILVNLVGVGCIIYGIFNLHSA